MLLAMVAPPDPMASMMTAAGLRTVEVSQLSGPSRVNGMEELRPRRNILREVVDCTLCIMKREEL